MNYMEVVLVNMIYGFERDVDKNGIWRENLIQLFNLKKRAVFIFIYCGIIVVMTRIDVFSYPNFCFHTIPIF